MTHIPPAFPQGINLSVDPDGTVNAELPCRKCSYNLKGLKIEGRCPECGSAVGLSVQGDLLRYSDPQWVRKLARGVKMIVWGISTLILIFIAAMIVGALGMMNFIWIVQGLGLLGSGLMLVGGWLLTEADPSGLGEDQYGLSRKLIRVALIVSLVSTILEWIRQFSPLPPNVSVALQIVGGLANLFGVVGQFAQLNYLSKLAMRIPDWALAQRSRFLMWAIGISYGGIILLGLAVAVVMLAAGGPGSAGILMPVGCVIMIAVIALLVFVFMYLRMLQRLEKRFTQEATAAEASWARLDAAATQSQITG